jgi:hypothetical protein
LHAHKADRERRFKMLFGERKVLTKETIEMYMDGRQYRSEQIRRKYFTYELVSFFKKGGSSLCRQQKALAAFCQAISSVATVRFYFMHNELALV